MDNRFLKKIIAQSRPDLNMISAICSEAEVKISEIKYLPKNKLFLISLERLNKEIENSKEKIKSIVKFEFIDSCKSINIDQTLPDLVLKLLAIDIFKRDNNYEIILLFSNNAFITLKSEIIECSLEDLKKIND